MGIKRCVTFEWLTQRDDHRGEVGHGDEVAMQVHDTDLDDDELTPGANDLGPGMNDIPLGSTEVTHVKVCGDQRVLAGLESICPGCRRAGRHVTERGDGPSVKVAAAIERLFAHRHLGDDNAITFGSEDDNPE